MKCFYRVETGFGERGDPCRQAELTRMRKRCDAAGLVDDLDHRLWSRTRTGNAAGTPAAEPAIERLLRVGDMSGVNHGPRDLRPSDRAAAVAGGPPHQRPQVHGHAQRGEAQANRLYARDSCRALRQQERAKRLVQGIKQITEHMEIPTLLYSRDLDAANRLHARFERHCTHLRDGPPQCRDRSRPSRKHPQRPRARQAPAARSDRPMRWYGDEGQSPLEHDRGDPADIELSPGAACRGGSALRRAANSSLALEQRAVLANQQIQMLALFVGEFQEDLLAFGILEALAVFLEEAV